MTVGVHPGIDRTDLLVRYDFNNTSSYDYRQNLVTYSEQFDNAAWTKSNATVTANAALAPDGTLTADRINEDATNGEHTVYYQQTISNVTQTFSVYIKGGERTQVALTMSNFLNADCRAYFDLRAGTLITVSATNADYTGISGTIVGVGGGWFRCSLTANKAAVNTTSHVSVMSYIQGTGTVFASSSANGLYVWGAQLVTGTTPVNYVATTASTITANTTAVNLATPGTYNGTLNGSKWYRRAPNTTLNSDVNIGALQFRNTSADYITAYTIPDSFWQGTWTVSMWVYLDEYSYTKGNDHAFVGHGAAGTTRKGLHLNERNGVAYFGLFGDDVAAPTPLTITVWQNLTFSYDPRQGRRKIYINGRLDLDHIFSGSVYTGTGTNTEIGRIPWQSAYNLSGRLADVQFYNSMLPDSQVIQNFALQRGRYYV